MTKNIEIILIFLVISLYSCNSTKIVSKNNKFYQFVETETTHGSLYKIDEIIPKANFKAKIVEKTDYIIIEPNDDKVSFDTIRSKNIKHERVNLTYKELINNKYYPEISYNNMNSKSLTYYDIKFGLQALTIPLKFRKGIGNDSINPPSVESGFNIGFAPGWKFTKNIYKQNKNYLGNNTTQIAIAVGPHFGLGATDLDKMSNSPGIVSNRSSPLFTYGVFLLFGFNNINIGFALGKDYVIGEGKNNWVYQGKTWTGVVVSLDILKY